jgi:hypothetical protein
MPAIEGTLPRLRLIKGHPAPDEDPHPTKSPPPGPHCTHAVAILRRSSIIVAPPPCRRASSGEGRN